jgi:20S proteasome alpha/beta subunit
MTLVLVIPAVEGIIMASDGQVTTGLVWAPGKKIFPLNERAAWAAAGELAVVQRLAERLPSLPPDRSLVRLRDDIGQVVKQCITEMIQLDFRASFYALDPETLLKLHPADFVFAEFSQSPHILHITVDGVPEWVNEAPFAAGSGDLFAYALLRKYQGKNLNLERAQVLAYKVMEEAIAVDAYGLGPPIDVWQISEAGIKNLSEAEKTMLAEAANRLREAEIGLLLNKEIL